MPPSASATPPTQTTQRVPNFSSKPIFCEDDGTGDGGDSGTAVGNRTGGCGGGEGSAGAATAGAGGGAGRAANDAAAPPATCAASTAFTLASSCRSRLRSVMLLIKATMPMTGAASNSSTIKANKSIGAPAHQSPLR